ncbi:MAG: hypothetical protein U0X75_26805 [Acidobacteriota bacterium]
MPAGVAAMLLTGALIGWMNGAAITKLGMPPFIVTLTTMMFFSGLAIWLTKSKTIYNLPPAFIAIGKGSLLFLPYARGDGAGGNRGARIAQSQVWPDAGCMPAATM